MPDQETPGQQRPFDVVVWGATGFTGRLVAAHLASKDGLAWALAGRNRDKLCAVRAEIAARFPSAARAPILIGDAGDPASLQRIAEQAKVIASTVGPFATFGEPIVRACVQSGTHYCDSTGEPHFVRRIIDTCHDAAREARVRIVPTCGFDSIPSDLGTLVLAEHALAKGRTLGETRAYVTGARGGVSGGTVASMLQIIDAGTRDRKVRRTLADPYGLSPDREHDLNLDGRDRMAPRWDETAGGWSAPWMMAIINTRVVRRSNALAGHRYGKQFRFEELLLMRGRVAGGIKAALVTGAYTLAGAVLVSSKTARDLAQRAMPTQGEGPSQAVRDAGFFKLRIYGTLEGDSRPSLVARVHGQGDPGYAATSRMVAESALCLAHDPPPPGFEGGVLTPATAMGMPLVERLRKVAISFDVESI